MYKIVTALIGALTLTSLASDQSFAEQAQIVNGASQKIDAHGACRVVKNEAGANLMVPYKAATEWVTGDNAFLSNITRMTGVSVSACSSPPANCNSTREPPWGAYLDGQTRNDEYFYDSIWDWWWNGVRLLRTGDFDATPDDGVHWYDVTYGYYTAKNDNESSYPIWRIDRSDTCQPKLDSPDRLKVNNVAGTGCIDAFNQGRCRGSNSFGTNPNFNTREMRVYDANRREALCLLQNGSEADFNIVAGAANHLAADGVTLIYTGVVRYPSLNDWLADFDSVLNRVGIFMPPGLDTCHVQSFAYMGTQWNNYVQFTHTFRRGTNGV